MDIGATRVDGMQLGEREGLSLGLICGSETLGNDSKTTLGMPF